MSRKLGPATPLGQILAGVDNVDESARRDWKKIEAERTRHNRSTETLTYRDFGVGKSRADGAQTGTEVERKISEISDSSAPAYKGEFLYQITRQTEPDICLELGSCLGISASYMLSALRENNSGILISIEGGESLSQEARATLQRLELPAESIVCGTFDETLDQILPTTENIDLAHIDGHHDGQALLRYVTRILPHFSAGAVLIVDDILWSSGMRRSWKSISELDRVSSSADLLVCGICQMK